LGFDLEGIAFCLPQNILHLNYPERLTCQSMKKVGQLNEHNF